MAVLVTIFDPNCDLCESRINVIGHIRLAKYASNCIVHSALELILFVPTWNVEYNSRHFIQYLGIGGDEGVAKKVAVEMTTRLFVLPLPLENSF